MMFGMGFDPTPLLSESAGITPAQWITDAYQQIYHRAPDTAGRDYWANVLGSSSRQAVIDSFTSAPEFCAVNPTDTLCGGGGNGGGGGNVSGGNGGGSNLPATTGGTLIAGIPDMYVYMGAAALALVIVMSMKKKG